MICKIKKKIYFRDLLRDSSLKYFLHISFPNSHNFHFIFKRQKSLLISSEYTFFAKLFRITCECYLRKVTLVLSVFAVSWWGFKRWNVSGGAGREKNRPTLNDRQPFSMSETYERAWREAIWGKHNLAGVATATCKVQRKWDFFIVRHRDAREYSPPPYARRSLRALLVP